MGHVYILCGPSGAGKTTFLKEVERRGLPFKQLQRITTRSKRKEEGDKGKTSLEYEFLSPEEFAGRLSRGNIVNFIEWNGNLYATDGNELDKAFDSADDYILFEDIPSAVALKDRYKSNTTLMLMFTDDKTEVDKIEFAYTIYSERPSILEWKRRLGLKYNASIEKQNRTPDEEGRHEYIKSKMARSVHDLAFIAGKIPKSQNIYVIANRKDQIEETINQFLDIVQGNASTIDRRSRVFIGSSSEGLPVARKLQSSLSEDFFIEIWNQGTVFGLGSHTLEALEDAVGIYDFGVFVFTPDDKLYTRGETKPVARDNVIFELGLFTGKLGRTRAFIVKPKNTAIVIPTDLAGITTATYDPENSNLISALEPACEKIRDAIVAANKRLHTDGQKGRR